MPKILFWTNAYAPMIGGAELWARRYLAALQARGHAIRIIAATDGDGATHHDTIDGIDILRLPLRAALSAHDPALLQGAITDASAAVADFAPDIIQISNFGVAALTLARLIRARLRAPLLLTAHNVWPDAAAAPGTPLDGVVRAARTIATFDPSIAHWLHGHWPDAPVTLIPHAVPPPAGPPVPLDPAGPFLFVGRLSPEKGVLVLVAAFASVLREAPHARLIIAGDGPERAAIHAAIAAHGIGHAVTLPGLLAPADVPGWIDRSLAVVIPSLLEGFGLVAAEAAWRARAVIASDVGGLPSTVTHGRTGLLCPPGDTIALAAAMLSLLRAPERAAALGEAGRTAIAARPGWAEHVDAFEQVFDRLLGV